ncbi:MULTISPECIES: hypothetical protein [unclassified Nonomuraea]|uniref:hypothetical protein n=1 Tax=unclassified Nonomuraea TaxID=2593643 RepID=UPI00340582B1
MADPHVSITLTFRTDWGPMDVLRQVLTVLTEDWTPPFEVTGVSASTFDMGDVEESGDG